MGGYINVSDPNHLHRSVKIVDYSQLVDLSHASTISSRVLMAVFNKHTIHNYENIKKRKEVLLENYFSNHADNQSIKWNT